ncbi:MAG: thiamine phosphate synthase [Cytophagaceae bacterium]|jgi:thiamine-phosphate pyrophosphorylase|nr:thiamine phosphate synthase [Cytophagaceae bacterium]
MNLIVCSIPDSIPEEQQLVQELLYGGLDTFHLRKPEFSIVEMREWMKQLSSSDCSKIVLHSHWLLAEEFNTKGIHMGANALKNMAVAEQEAWMAYTKRKKLTISSSVHDQEEINRLPKGFDYVWLSPVFESISKQDYKSAYSASQFDAWVEELKEQKETKVYALGGIRTEHMKELAQRGFDGAVVLGNVWSNVNGLQDRELVKERIQHLIVACKTDPTS